MRRAGVVALLAALVVCGCAPTGPVPTPTYSSPSPLPLPTSTVSLSGRAAHTATRIGDGSILVVGGCKVDGCTTATDSVYVVSTAGADPVAPLHQPRDAHTATLLASGEVLVVGGFSAEGTAPLAGAEVFIPTTQMWEEVGGLGLGRGGHAAARLGGGRVVVAGGWIGPRRYTASTEIYDPHRQEFRSGPLLPVAVDGLSAVSLADGTALVTGGQQEPGVASSMAVLISSDGSSAQPVGPLLHPRFKHTMVTLLSGEVLVIGGTSDDRTLLNSTEIYDPVSRSFRDGPDMVTGRYKLAGAATLLPGGRVLVAGGGEGLEVIDPSRGNSQTVDAGGPIYAAFSSVTLFGDSIRVIGGYDGAIQLTHTDLTIGLDRIT